MSDTINALIGAQRSASVLDRIANPPQINPLAGIEAGANAAKTVMGVRGLAAHQAWGEALAASTDPQTGVVNYGDAVARMARDSRGALGMPEATEGASARMNEQLNRGHMLMGMMHGAVGGIDETTTAPTQLRAQLNSVFDRLEAAGAPNVAQERTLIPKNDADLPGYVQQLRRAGDMAVSQTGLLYGTTGQIQTGGAAVPYVQAPASRGGAITTATGAVPSTLTPGQQTLMIDFVNPDTQQPERLPLTEYMNKYGWKQPGSPGAPAAAPSSGASGANAKPAPAAAPASVVAAPTGPTPDNLVRWEASRKQFVTDNEASTNYVQRMWPITQAINIMETDPQAKTGAGADALNQIKSFVSTMLPGDGTISSVKSFDELGKYFNQIVTSNPAFSRSDAMLGTALGGSPNTHLSTLANIDVGKGMVALERMKQMAMIDFKAQGGLSHPRDWTEFLSNYQLTHDPRAFVYSMLKQDKKEALLKSMDGNTAAKKQERINFNATLDLLHQHPEILTSTAMPQ